MRSDEDYLRLTLDIARPGARRGQSSVRCDPGGSRRIGAAGGRATRHGDAGDRTGHAERVLMTRASVTYPAEFLAACPMYASAEPCAMCAGSAYWAGVGRVVYGLSERDLPRADRPPSGEPDHGPAVPRRPCIQGNERSRSWDRCWKTSRAGGA